MGYNTRYMGEIRIVPPIGWGELSDADKTWIDPWNSNHYYDCALQLDEEPVDTPDGTLTRKQVTAIIPASEDDYKGYGIVEAVQGIVDRWAPTGRTFGGYLECEGEEAGDLWRLAVVDGRATRIEPRIIWPDLSEEPKR